MTAECVAAAAAAVAHYCQMVMSFYETDLKHPIRSLITGELARTLLIQVRRLPGA